MRYLLLITVASWIFLPTLLAEDSAKQKDESLPLIQKLENLQKF